MLNSMAAALCILTGHAWVFDRNEPGPVGNYGEWWWNSQRAADVGLYAENSLQARAGETEV